MARREVILDTAGNLYIADTGSNAVRKVNPASGIITSVAGNGTACATTTAACGDSGAATAANLKAPAGVALNTTGLIIADTGDNRVRAVNTSTGIITTIAGTGTAGYTGDGGAATSATLNAPGGVTTDSAGDVYIAGTTNSVIRFVSAGSGKISTIVGTGTACATSTASCGDSGASTSAMLATPGGIALDGPGNLYVSDTGDNRVRKVNVTSLALNFASTAVGATSSDSPQSLAVENIGNQTLTVSIPGSGTNPAISTGFNLGGSSTCPQLSSISSAATLSSGQSCAYAVNFAPATAGTFAGTLAVTDSSLNASSAAQTVNLNGVATKGSPATTLVSSTNPSTFGQSVTFTATVGGLGVTPTGTVSFYNGATLLGTGTVNGSGVATYATSTLLIGSDSITAVYSGDANYNSSTSNAVTQTVNRANGADALTTSNAAPIYGTSITLTDTIPTVNGVAPTGTVTFYNGGTAIGTGTVNASGVATLAAGALPVGSDSITAVYGGDANYASVTSNAVTEAVSKANGADALTTSNASPAYGTSITLTDTIPTVNGVAPTGTVTFYNGGTAIGTGTVNASGVATLAYNSLPAGTDTVTAVYGGDADYASVTSNGVTETVGSSATIASTTALASSTNPTKYGQTTTLTATVASTSGGATPTGTVIFYTPGTPTVVNLQATGSSTTLSQTLSLGAGTYSISIIGNTNGGLYTGWNPAANPSSNMLWTDRYGLELCGTCTSLVNDISGAPGANTNTQALSAFQAAPLFNLSTNNLIQGMPVNNPYTFTLASPQSVSLYVPDGSFVNGAFTNTSSFADDSGGLSLAVTQLTAIGTGTVNASGVASAATNSLPVGTDPIEAVYSGDNTYIPSSSSALNQTVNKANGADALTTSNASPTYGSSITLTDTIPTVNGVASTGTVTFYDGSTAIGTGTVNASGVATLATGALSVGTDSITAVYGGDANYASVTSNALTETVAKANGAGALTTSNASPTYGTSITLTDTIPTVNGVAPTGTVTFYNGGTSIGTGTVSASGVATLVTGALPVGTDSITAVYGGDANYAQVTSNALTETVAKANGANALTTSNASPTYGTSITLTDTIPTVNGIPPTGTVTFYNGGTAIGTGTVNASGLATLATGVLPVGADSVTAVYGGDANYASVTSNAVTETVGKANGADALTSSNASPSYGTSITLTDTIPIVNGVVPTGTVTFYDGSTAIGTGTVNASGVATLATGSLPIGSDSITAVYGGDANYASVTSNAMTETVGKANGADALTTSNASPNYGTSITLTDTILTANGVAPTGTVTFYNGGTSIGTGTVNASGVATLATGSLPVGSDSITAVYSGDANYAQVTSNAVEETVAKANGADALTSSNATPTYGTSVTLTDTIPTVNGVAPTGTVTFYNGSTAIGTGTVNASGLATLATGVLPVGADSVTAVYGGDANYASVTSNAVTETVAKANGADALTTSNASPTYGSSITLTDTIPTVNGVAPTGTVTFYDGSTAIGTGTVNASGAATLTTGSLPVGTDSITAVYGGDGNYASVTSNAITATVGKANGAVALTSSNATPTYGTSITLTETIPVANGVAPTGTVTFYNGSTAIGTGAVNSSGVAALVTRSLPVGSDSITAVYSGDADYAQVSSNALTETVAKANGADALTGSPSSPMYGDPVTFTDTIPTVNGVAPTGTVTFYDGSTAIGTGTVNSSGVAILVTGALPTGTGSITAVYGGDSNYASVTSNAITETVAKASGADALTSSNTAPVYGSSFTLTDTIPTVNGVAPTGMVTFYNGSTAIGTGTVNSSGVAALATGALPVGTDTITAVYGGDGNYAPVTSNAVTETVAKANGADALTSSNTTPSYGASITLTDTIPTVNGVAPTGTVTFYNGSTVVGTGTVNASGIATLTTGSLPVGTESITAVYAGDANYASVTSNAITETVGKSSGADTLATSNTAPAYGASVTFTDTIPTVNSVAPTGTVTFYNGGSAIGTGTVNASGIATLTTGSLPIGTDIITAAYGGDGNYGAITSNAVTETVSKAHGADTLTASSTTPTYGTSITLTHTIPVVNGVAPTGTVTFYNGSAIIGTGTVNSSGVATLTTGGLPVGSDSLTAVYSGDVNYAAATSNPVAVTIAKANGADTLTTSNANVAVGVAVTFTDTIPIANGTAPTGIVTFLSGGVVIGTGTVSSSGVATLTTSTLPAGTNTVTAMYGGDANYAVVTSNSVSEVVGTPDTLTVSNASPMFGSSVTLTLTVPMMNGFVPTGTVTFYDNGVAIGTGTISPSGVATFATSSFHVGPNHVITAYSGDTNYPSAASGPVDVNVVPATGADTLTASNTTPAFGASVTLTDTIPTVGGVAPTGTVTFYSNGVAIGTGTVNASGVATLATGTLPVGADNVTAVYSGDTNYGAVTTGPLTITVGKGGGQGTDTLSTSNASPSLGTSVTLTDTVPAINGVAPTGTVTFYSNGTAIGTGTVSASGAATLTTGALPLGTDTITTAYSGDGNYSAGTSNSVTETVGKANGADTLTASVTASMLGQPVTFTDTVPVVNGVAPTGTVTFYNGSTAIGTGTVSASGFATLTTGTLPLGADTVTASYSGDADYLAGTSNGVVVMVGKGDNTDTLTASATASKSGQPVTFTDMAAPINGVEPTGTVTFYLGAKSLGTGTLNATGVATLATSALPVGTDSITASYGGDDNFATSVSNAVTVTVSKASATDVLTSSNTTPMFGASITLTDTLTAVNGIAPTGTVTFYAGSTAIGTGTVNSSGVASLTTGSLPVGTATITAVYGGDANYNQTTSNAVTETVATAGGTNSDTLTTSNPSPVLGEPVTFTETIPIVNGIPPTGTVTFYIGSTVLGTATVDSSGVATLTTSSVPTGTSNVSAVYSGDANYSPSTSSPVTETVADFTIKATPPSQTVDPGQSASYAVSLAGAGLAFNQPVVLSATGLPSDIVAVFSPASLTPGAGPAPTTMTLITSFSAGIGDSRTPGIAYALLLLPLAGSRKVRRKLRSLPSKILYPLAAVLLCVATGALTGCGGGYFGHSPTTYTVTVTGASGPLHHSTSVNLTVR